MFGFGKKRRNTESDVVTVREEAEEEELETVYRVDIIGPQGVVRSFDLVGDYDYGETYISGIIAGEEKGLTVTGLGGIFAAIITEK